MPLKFIIKYFNLTRNESYFVIAFFIFISSLLGFTFYGPNYNGTSKSIEFEIKQGDTFNQVVNDLHVKNIIPNKVNLKAAAFLFGMEKNIKAGVYQIPDGISYIKLLQILNEGAPKEQHLVTIPEGIWQSALAEILAKDCNVSSKRVMDLSKDKIFINSLGLDVNNLEGYLLPNTYYFYKGSSEEDLLRRLSHEMDLIFDDLGIQQRMLELKRTKAEILTIASIIDGESNLVSEFRKISGVYYNRLKKGWKLQADPTVQYVVRQKRKKVNQILWDDLEIDSKYNTYKYYGLPPTPINNPGKEAIMAALYPEEHNLFYFVADGTGGHVFAKSSKEHERNVVRYRNWREQNNK